MLAFLTFLLSSIFVNAKTELFRRIIAYRTYEAKRLGSHSGLWRGIKLENTDRWRIHVQELEIKYGSGSPTIIRNIIIQPNGSHYQDFRGALRKIDYVRIVLKADVPAEWDTRNPRQGTEVRAYVMR